MVNAVRIYFLFIDVLLYLYSFCYFLRLIVCFSIFFFKPYLAKKCPKINQRSFCFEILSKIFSSFFTRFLPALGETNIIQIIPIIVIFNTVLSRIALMPSPRIHCSLPQPQRQPKLLQFNPHPSSNSIQINKNRFPSQVLKILSDISKISSQAPHKNLPQQNSKINSPLTCLTDKRRQVQYPLPLNHISHHQVSNRP